MVQTVDSRDHPSAPVRETCTIDAIRVCFVYEQTY